MAISLKDISFKDNKEAQQVIDLVLDLGCSVFLTGNAGTGKSTLLRYIVAHCEKKFVLLAPTGIAALNIRGQTIHSFFGFGFQPYLRNDTDLPNLKAKIDLLQKIDLFIIDEISMVRADIMNAIDLTLKKYLGNNKPFGGKQLLVVGDLLQLPPVLNSKNYQEAAIMKANYANEFFFSAPVFEDYELEVIELKKVYRQEEALFVNALNKIRLNQVDAEVLQIINSRFQYNYQIPEDKEIITLSTRNDKVNSINTEQLVGILEPIFNYKADLKGTFLEGKFARRLPTERTLQLKVGAQVIFVKNNMERKWVNGSIGRVVSLTDESIEVEVKGKRVTVEPDIWEDIDYQWDREKNVINKEVVGTFKQYPLRLAWAITIHKSQGQTFEEVIIDLDSGAFANGQTYVALSRCTSLEGIVLTKKVNLSDIKVSSAALKYLREKGFEEEQEEFQDFW